ncbi:hypothetical protein ILUMI_08521 [Ignelater luminosus]|uniref:AAA+ ATPase domain-containing protein n=1 Tax=Ignelater luminosus TaxID=2038154 RepID=A0A8K0D1R7_IGNLU|nr:hypothetical protein ILUMI_08521 [Ignelater luminosus]
MSDHQTFLLDLYHEAVQCFQDLSAVFEQTPQLLTLSKRQQIDICLEKVQHLIQIEEANPSYDKHNREIVSVLPLLYTQLQQLKYNHNFTQITSCATSTSIKTSQKAKEEKDLRDSIKKTQITPRIQGFEDIAGLFFVKKILATLVLLPIRQPQLYANQKISNSILLYGPPGTGKTQLVHALAAEASACLFSVAPSNILSCYIGQSEKLIHTLFKIVKEKRDHTTILFMDEIDGLCRRRSGDEAEWSRRLKTELLCQLTALEDCPNIFLICATNCPWDLDPAFYRRFQKRIYIPLPSRPDRFDLLKLFTKNTSLETTSNEWGPLLSKTEGYSGSDLADLVRHAFNIPLTELIDNKSWVVVNDNLYQPASVNHSFTSLIQCDVQELPPKSVQARNIQFTDLMAAANAVKKTISDADIKRYEMFENII